jgi:hypothetical protein
VKAAFQARGSPARFRQAAIVYLHYGILYDLGVYVVWQQGILPEARGPAELWLLLGAFLAISISYALWRWQHRWFALLVWGVVMLRLPAMMRGAFFGQAHTGVEAVVPPAMYFTGLVVTVINMVMLARAGFDL